MWKDPIVEEVRAIRDEHARAFGYDADAIFADLVRAQSAHEREGIKFVNFEPRRPLGWVARAPASSQA